MRYKVGSVLLLIGCMLAASAIYYFQLDRNGSIVAYIDDIPVTQGEVNFFLHTIPAEQPGAVSHHQAALNEAIRFKLQAIQARKEGLSLSELDQQRVEQRIQIERVAGSGSKKEKQQFYHLQYGMSSESEYRLLRQDESLVEDLKTLKIAQYALREQEMLHYYELHSDKYIEPYSVAIEYLTLDLEASETEVINKIYEKLQSGTAFSEIQENHPQASGIVKKYGEKVVRYRQQFPELYRQLTKRPPAIGTILPPFPTDDTIHVIKIMAYEEGSKQPYEYARPMIEKDLKELYYEKLVQDWMEDVQVTFNLGRESNE